MIRCILVGNLQRLGGTVGGASCSDLIDHGVARREECKAFGWSGFTRRGTCKGPNFLSSHHHVEVVEVRMQV